VHWNDPNVWGSRWTLDASAARRDDGNSWSFATERPFYSLDTRTSMGASTAFDERIESRYGLGEIVDDYRVSEKGAELYFGSSSGLRDGWTRRLVGGYRYDSARFGPGDRPLAGALPQDRILSYPFLRIEALEDRYAAVRNQDQISRIEDVHLGASYTAEIGLATPAFGSDRTAALIHTSASRGWRNESGTTLLLASSLASRFEGGDALDTLIGGSARYYRHTSEHTLFCALLHADYGHQLDRDHSLDLGGDNGLRGYPLRYQAGSSRALLSVEERLFTGWYPFRLVHVGAAAFADVGRTWGTDPLHTPNRGLLKSVGLGLRLGNARSALGNVLHIDVAFPLDRDPEIDGIQFLIETKASF
jgi:outer membrane protein assembly factor BamA